MNKLLVCQECGEPVEWGDELCDQCRNISDMIREASTTQDIMDALALYRRYRDGYEG